MTNNNPLLKSIRESAGMRLAVLFGSFFILLILSSFISLAVDSVSTIGDRTKMLITSTVQCILAFCIPAVLVAKYSGVNAVKWLELTRAPQLKAIAGVILIYIISMPAMEWLIQWNANLHLPESMAPLEEVMRQWEANAEEATKVLLDSQSLLSMIAGVLVVGVLTGFSEELFFRGGLQGIFTRTNIGSGASVWLAAIVFSTMHFQFFGFFPRLLMGVFFGYLLIWTRSLWVPIFAHALNNSIVVISNYFTGSQTQSLITTGDEPSFLSSLGGIVLSIVLTATYLIIFKDYFFKNPASRKNEPWQRSQLPPVSGR